MWTPPSHITHPSYIYLLNVHNVLHIIYVSIIKLNQIKPYIIRCIPMNFNFILVWIFGLISAQLIDAQGWNREGATGLLVAKGVKDADITIFGSGLIAAAVLTESVMIQTITVVLRWIDPWCDQMTNTLAVAQPKVTSLSLLLIDIACSYFMVSLHTVDIWLHLYAFVANIE